jgi:hypothetical protein
MLCQDTVAYSNFPVRCKAVAFLRFKFLEGMENNRRKKRRIYCPVTTQDNSAIVHLDNDSCWLAAISFVSRMKEQ